MDHSVGIRVEPDLSSTSVIGHYENSHTDVMTSQMTPSEQSTFTDQTGTGSRERRTIIDELTQRE